MLRKVGAPDPTLDTCQLKITTMKYPAQIHTAIQQLNQKVKELGLPEIEDLMIDGEIHRFGPKQVGWYCLEDDGYCLSGYVGNHKHNNGDLKSSHYFECQYRNYASEEEKEAARKHREAFTHRREAEEMEKRAAAEKEAQRIWDASTEVDSHPYLSKKDVYAFGIRKTNEPVPGLLEPKLVIPFYSLDKTLRTLQFIDETGRKSWLAGGAKNNHYYRIPGSSSTLYIAEGYATAASIHMATNQSVVMAGDAGNLSLVAKTFRGRIPKQCIVICADNDQWTEGNPGISAATAAARAIHAKVAIPELKNTSSNPTDFNDLHQFEGLQEVKRQLETTSEFSGDFPILIRLSEVMPKSISWLWPNRIALGKLSIIAGDPGLGKSLMALDIAAHVTRGKPWPVDQTPCPSGEVVLLSAEDDIADTIRPRLDAVHADVSKVHVLTTVKTKDPETNEVCERMVSLRKDIFLLSRMLSDYPECVLVIIDPLSAYLGGVDSHKNADVREFLAPLSNLAEKQGVAITCSDASE